MAYVPLQISIPEPCSESWDGMTPLTDNSRHCASCEKEITDFSFMTDAEIGRTLAANGGRLCGRFRSGQLDRRLQLNGPRRRRGLGPVAAAASLLLAAPVYAQSTEPVATEQTERASEKPNGRVQGNVVLRGKVVDSEDDEGLIGATILIKGTTSGTVTDLDGFFELQLKAGEDITLVFSYTGYETQELALSASEIEQNTANGSVMSIGVQPSPITLMGELIVIGYPKSNSILDHLLVHKVDPIVIDRPLGPAKGDWKAYWRELFAERKARRADRKLERQTKKAEQPAEDVEKEELGMVENLSRQAEAPLQSFGLKASPNPFTTEITASFSLESAGSVRLSLLDGNGRTLREWQYSAVLAGAQSFRLDGLPGKLPAGAYYLRLRSDGGGVETITVVR